MTVATSPEEEVEEGRGVERKEANFLLSDLARGRGVLPGIGTSSMPGESVAEGEGAARTSVNSTAQRNHISARSLTAKQRENSPSPTVALLPNNPPTPNLGNVDHILLVGVDFGSAFEFGVDGAGEEEARSDSLGLPLSSENLPNSGVVVDCCCCFVVVCFSSFAVFVAVV